MPSKRQRRKRIAEKAAVNKTREDASCSFRGRVERTTPDKCAETMLTCRNASTAGLSMLAGAEVAPEFEMTDTRAAEFGFRKRQDSNVVQEQHVVITQENAGDAPEFTLGKTHVEKCTDPALPTHTKHTVTGETVLPIDADPPLMVAAQQLMQQLQLKQFPAEWDSPIVQPLLMEVLTERAKKIMTARKRRSKRRENRKLKW